jgi:signal recognition particle subunit SRP54
VVQIVNEELTKILGGEARRLQFAKTPPTVIMLAGLQGSGKTTLAGKLAKWLKEQNHTVLLVAADLQRPNAVNQLQVLGERVGVSVFAPEAGNGVGNPVKVSKDAIAHAKKSQFSVVIVDTAGRLGVDEEMMGQARDIRDAVAPNEILFVVDSMLGQDAVNVAQAFNDGVGVSGVVLTKLDGDSRGGAALSVATITGAPILFSSTGEGLDAFEPFYPDRMASRILDMGDVISLIEQAQKNFDAEESQKLADKIATESFTLQDFLEQMQQLRKMGNMKNILGMLPGAGKMKKQLEDFDEGEIARTEAIIFSMTPTERNQPKVLNGSRRLRIAKGSGTSVTEVNALVNRFEQAAKMMKTMAKGGMPNIPGTNPVQMGGAVGGGYIGGKKKDQKKKGSKSGNPAKRAAENAGISFGKAPESGAGSAFGLNK